MELLLVESATASALLTGASSWVSTGPETERDGGSTSARQQVQQPFQQPPYSSRPSLAAGAAQSRTSQRYADAHADSGPRSVTSNRCFPCKAVLLLLVQSSYSGSLRPAAETPLSRGGSSVAATHHDAGSGLSGIDQVVIGVSTASVRTASFHASGCRSPAATPTAGVRRLSATGHGAGPALLLRPLVEPVTRGRLLLKERLVAEEDFGILGDVDQAMGTSNSHRFPCRDHGIARRRGSGRLLGHRARPARREGHPLLHRDRGSLPHASWPWETARSPSMDASPSGRRPRGDSN